MPQNRKYFCFESIAGTFLQGAAMSFNSPSRKMGKSGIISVAKQAFFLRKDRKMQLNKILKEVTKYKGFVFRNFEFQHEAGRIVGHELADHSGVHNDGRFRSVLGLQERFDSFWNNVCNATTFVVLSRCGDFSCLK